MDARAKPNETSSKTQHTPGPWTYSAGPHRVVVERDHQSPVGEADPEQPHTVADLGPVEAWGNERTRANARLIAQAPRMASFVESVVHEIAMQNPADPMDLHRRMAQLVSEARLILAAIEGSR